MKKENIEENINLTVLILEELFFKLIVFECFGYY